MLVMIVLIVMIISSALMLALLSGFLPFVQNYGNMMQYTAAYYGALSAVERGLLATRYAGPGFDGESGWKNWTNHNGHSSDTRLDHFYTYGNGQDSLYRTVKSSTQRIPAEWKGNVDPNFINPYASSIESSHSSHYNALNYGTTEVVPLGSVGQVQSNQYYSKLNDSFNYQNGGNIAVNFRFNPYLAEKFRNKNNSTFSNAEDAKISDKDLPFVNWTVRGQYGEWSNNRNPFSFLPRRWENIHQPLHQGLRIQAPDTIIRGTQLNWDQNRYGQNLPLVFWNSKDVFWRTQNDLNTQNIISLNEENLKNMTYRDILTHSNTSEAILNLSLLNVLKTPGGIYPFLEYQVVSSNGNIADRFYTIEGEGKVNNYHIKMQVKKPTLPQPALWAFTIIF